MTKLSLTLVAGTLITGFAAKAADQTSNLQPDQAFGKISLAFETNQGQTDPSVRFLARGAGSGNGRNRNDCRRDRGAEPVSGSRR